MKRNKFLTVILGIAIFSGIVCSGVVIAQGIQDGKELSQQNEGARKRERYPQAWELEKTKLEEFSELSISLDYCNLSILPGDDYYLEYRLDGANAEPAYSVSNGIFSFQEGPLKTKYSAGFHFFFNPWFCFTDQEPYYVNLYVPEEQYFEQLTLFNESGNIDIGKIQAKEASIRISYGNLNINSFTGKNLSIEAESGNLTLDSVACRNLNLVDSYGNCFGDTFQVSGQTAINLESGNLELSRLETDSLNFSDEYGNCTIDEITLKEGDFSMESGNLVLSNALLGTSSIRNSYGIVNLELNGSTSDYNYDLTTEYGSIDFDGKYITVEEDASNIYYRKDNHQKNQIYINCESGNISIRSK